jgi:hypothetical protein
MIRDVLRDYLVPIYTFDDDELRKVAFVQSGVLVRLQGRAFVLTAGHCVEDWEHRPMAFGVRWDPHRFTPTIATSAFRYDDKCDYGFWEISHGDIGHFSYQRKFVQPARIELSNPNMLREKEGSPIITGYPADLIIGDWDRSPTSRFLSYLTTVEGVDDAPEGASEDNKSEDCPVIDTVIAEENFGSVSEVPHLGGASGGGYWWLEPMEEGTKLSADHFKLIGTHSGHYCTDKGKFARGHLIENHLHLIADEVPELRDFINETWP